MADLRTPRQMRHQAEIEAIPECDRTAEQRRSLAEYREISEYWPIALGDR